MNKKLYASLLGLVILVGAVAGTGTPVLGQKRGGAASTQARLGLLSSLPASDAVVLLDVQRLLKEAMPRLLDRTKLAQANAEIERFKTRTGLDPRSFESIAIGMRFTSLDNGMTKAHTVALARGQFNAAALVAAGRLAAKGKYQEQKYKGATLYIFDLNDQVKMFGILNMRVNQLAVSALDANTLALGDPEVVRAAIDAGRGGGRVKNELAELATRNPNAMIGFGANVPQFVTQGINVPNDEIARNLASVRQVFGSVGTTTSGFDSLLVARTENAEQAKSLSDTISALKQFGPLLSGRLSGPKAKLAQDALESLQVNAQGNELRLRLELAQADLDTLISGF